MRHSLYRDNTMGGTFHIGPFGRFETSPTSPAGSALVSAIGNAQLSDIDGAAVFAAAASTSGGNAANTKQVIANATAAALVGGVAGFFLCRWLRKGR